MITICVTVGILLAIVIGLEWLLGLYYRFVALEDFVVEMRADQLEDHPHRQKQRSNVYILRGGGDDEAA